MLITLGSFITLGKIDKLSLYSNVISNVAGKAAGLAVEKDLLRSHKAAYQKSYLTR